jgi:HPt (histidine-containing phosphotransfer) domain-containing protein
MNAICASTALVIDFAALDARCMRNAALMQRILNKFKVQLEDDLTRLYRAADSGNAIEAAELAHRIKGTAGSVEAIRLRENATVAERFALDGRLAELRQWLVQLTADQSDINVEIGGCLNSFKTSSTLIEA